MVGPEESLVKENRMSKKEEHLLWVMGGIALGLVLLSSPRCNRGCRTLAEHMITHGIDELV
jgi:hypothetical protein